MRVRLDGPENAEKKRCDGTIADYTPFAEDFRDTEVLLCVLNLKGDAKMNALKMGICVAAVAMGSYLVTGSALEHSRATELSHAEASQVFGAAASCYTIAKNTTKGCTSSGCTSKTNYMSKCGTGTNTVVNEVCYYGTNNTQCGAWVASADCNGQ